MRAKYRALDRRVREVEKVVDRCIEQHGRHLSNSIVASLRARSVRYAEGMLCLMSVEELSSRTPEHTMLRERVVAEIYDHTVSSIGNAVPPASALVN
jgi:hypothetical protein